MRAYLLPAFVALAPMVYGAQLRVAYTTLDATSVITRSCERYAEGPNKGIVGSESRAGSISLSVSGGTPPYTIAWHTMHGSGGKCLSAWPGMHRVTVTDAAGERVTRSIHVGRSERIIKLSCPPDPLQVPCAPIEEAVEVKKKPAVYKETARIAPRHRKAAEDLGPPMGGGPERPVQRRKEDGIGVDRPIVREPKKR